MQTIIHTNWLALGGYGYIDSEIDSGLREASLPEIGVGFSTGEKCGTLFVDMESQNKDGTPLRRDFVGTWTLDPEQEFEFKFKLTVDEASDFITDHTVVGKNIEQALDVAVQSAFDQLIEELIAACVDLHGSSLSMDEKKTPENDRSPEGETGYAVKASLPFNKEITISNYYQAMDDIDLRRQVSRDLWRKYRQDLILANINKYSRSTKVISVDMRAI